jgi:hypothetical protein
MKTTKTKILAGAALTAVTTAASLAGITAQSGAVSMGWSGQAAMIAAVGPSNSLDVYSQQLGATTSFAQVGNLSLIAVQGPNNHLVVYAQTSGSPTWTPEVVPGAATFGKPSIAAWGTSAIIAAKGPTSSLDSYTQPSGATTWTPQVVAAANTTFSVPSIAQVGNSAVITAVGPSGSLEFYWQDTITPKWNPEKVAAAGTSVGNPSITQIGNYSVIAAQGSGHTLTVYQQAIGAPDWTGTPVPGATVESDPSIVWGETFANNTQIAFISFEGPNTSYQRTYYSPDFRLFRTDCVLGYNNACGGTVYSTPSYVKINGTTFGWAYVGPNHSLIANDTVANPNIDGNYIVAGNGSTFG